MISFNDYIKDLSWFQYFNAHVWLWYSLGYFYIKLSVLVRQRLVLVLTFLFNWIFCSYFVHILECRLFMIKYVYIVEVKVVVKGFLI